MVKKFIWDNKPAKIKYKCLISLVEDGGLKLQDLATKIKSIKLKWYKQMIIKDISTPWKAYINSYFKEDVSKILSYNCSREDLPKFKDEFYTELFDVWTKLHCKEPTTAEEIVRQPIYHNKFIRIDNKTINGKLRATLKMEFIQDLLGPDMKIAQKEYLDNKYNTQIPQMLYNSVISAIPRTWKNLIGQDSNVLNYYVFEDHKISLDIAEKKVVEISTKELYWSLISTIAERPTSENTWEVEVGLGYDLDKWAWVYNTPYLLTKDTKLIMFQYKVSHRILACKYKLRVWKIETDDICNCCQIAQDSLEHHLVACPDTLNFWNNAFNWFKSVTGVLFPIDTYDIILGIPNPNEDAVIDQLNFVILQGKYFIYKCKLNNKSIDFYLFLVSLKLSLNIKESSVSLNNREKSFKRIWEPLLESM